MIIWLILLSLSIFDLFYTIKYLSPNKREEYVVYYWFLLFFINYAPLATFEVYQNEISIYLNSLGLTIFDKIDIMSFLHVLWSLFLNFLNYSSLFHWYCFWILGIISLVQIYEHSKDLIASCYIGLANSFLFLFYNASATNNECLLLYVITIGIFLWTHFKLCYYKVRKRNTFRIMNKYLYLINASTLFTIKRFFYFELDVFDISYYFLSFIFSFGIFYIFAFYHAVSYTTTLFYFQNIYIRYQENRKQYFNIEENSWKIFSAYALMTFFTCSMFLIDRLVENLWGDIWALKEVKLFVAAGGLGYVLIYPKDEISNHDNNPQFISNSVSVYCLFWVVRSIIRFMNY